MFDDVQRVWLCCMSKLACVFEVAILQMFKLFMNGTSLFCFFKPLVLKSGLKIMPPTDHQAISVCDLFETTLLIN